MNNMIPLRVDDFDPVVHYDDYTVWQTPNPQDNPTWWSADRSTTGVPWYQATYHNTTSQGATASFNFTSSFLKIYGSNGGQYSVTIDGAAQPLSPNPVILDDRQVLFDKTDLSEGIHFVQIRNDGGWLLLDEFEVKLRVAGDYDIVMYDQADDRHPMIKYTGEWTQQNGENFFNKTSTYTSGPGNALELVFNGTTVLLYGDQVNDHGEYTVSINGSAVGTYNGRSGCGGGYAKHCEKLRGLLFLGGPYPAGNHTLRIENGGPSDGNKTFFDFDYATWYTTIRTKPIVPGGSPSSMPMPPSSSGGDTSASGPATLWLVLGSWVLSRMF